MAPNAANPNLRRALAIALAALAALLAPAAAQAAGSAYVAYGTLTYLAAPGAANHLVANSDGSTVQLTDSGAGVSIAPGRGCSGSGQSVTCTGVSTLSLNVGDGDNFVDSSAVALPTAVNGWSGADEIHTGPSGDVINAYGGNDVLDGGPGSDYLNGGSGDDLFMTRDGAVDGLACGSGNDRGTADPGDSRGSDCEAIDTSTPTSPAGGALPTGSGSATEPAGTSAGGASGTTPGPGSGGGSPATQPPGGSNAGLGGRSSAGFDLKAPINLLPPIVPAQTAAVTPAGVALVQVVCPSDAGRCKGSVALYVAAAVPARGKLTAARRRKLVKLGGSKFKAAAGRKPLVRVRLNRRGRRRILRHRHRKTRVQVVVTTRTASGALHTTKATISLRPRRTAARRGKR